uniref:Uncharacterized protein n=1 Tax=Panagrolaimus sp. JU765 TaxID=591449 RepID=A0AC34R6H5_9BILA
MPDVWWNGYDNATCKDPTYARKFRGTNTDFFAPFVKKTDILEGYVDDICRSVNFNYLEETTVKGIDTYRFVLDIDTSFNYDRPENCGYCYKQNHPLYGRNVNTSCLPTGLLDLVGCRGGGTTHLVVSMPQFFGSEKSVLRSFPRMKPEEDHQTTLDIEPTTGSILYANKRLQVNVAGGSYPGTVFRQVANVVYPIAWLNNSYLVDDKIVHDLKHDLINPRHTVMLVCYIAGVGFGALLALIGLFSLILRKVYQNTKSPSILVNDISDQPHEYHPQYTYNGDVSGQVTRRRPMQNSHEEWAT